MVQNSNIQANVPKTYLKTSWLGPGLCQAYLGLTFICWFAPPTNKTETVDLDTTRACFWFTYFGELDLHVFVGRLYKSIHLDLPEPLPHSKFPWEFSIWCNGISISILISEWGPWIRFRGSQVNIFLEMSDLGAPPNPPISNGTFPGKCPFGAKH